MWARQGLADLALSDRDEAWQITERGPMRLHIADIHLYRARLFRAHHHYRWTSPKHDISQARALITQCGDRRRDQELADAVEALEK